MRLTLTLLFILSLQPVFAQKHSIYADAGYRPSISATYNYKLTQHLGVGIGIQAYSFTPTPNLSSIFMPSIFANLRVKMLTTKKNQLFTFLDFGINFYKQDKSYRRDSTTISHYPHNNGFNWGIGLGYFRLMTKRGGGPYLSLKLISNWYTLRGYSIVSERDEIGLLNIEARPIIALGFKF